MMRVSPREARHLNRIIDRALLAPSRALFQGVLDSCILLESASMADRVHRRAAALSKSDLANRRSILEARDELVLTIYQHFG